VFSPWINRRSGMAIRWIVGLAGGFLGAFIVMGAWFFQGFNRLYSPESGIEWAVLSVAGAGLLVAIAVPMAMVKPTRFRVRMAALAILLLAASGLFH